jgi:hypothetical protein
MSDRRPPHEAENADGVALGLLGFFAQRTLPRPSAHGNMGVGLSRKRQRVRAIELLICLSALNS